MGHRPLPFHEDRNKASAHGWVAGSDLTGANQLVSTTQSDRKSAYYASDFLGHTGYEPHAARHTATGDYEARSDQARLLAKDTKTVIRTQPAMGASFERRLAT